MEKLKDWFPTFLVLAGFIWQGGYQHSLLHSTVEEVRSLKTRSDDMNIRITKLEASK